MLSELLSLDRPIVSRKMLDFLRSEGVWKLLIGFVAQDGDLIDDMLTDGSTDPSAALPAWEQEKDALLAEKRSYHAMELLRNENLYGEMLTQHMPEALMALGRCFRPMSKANLYHWKTVMESLLPLNPQLVRSCLLTEDSIGTLLRHLEHPAVSDVLAMLLSNIYTQSRDERLRVFHAATTAQLFPQLWTLLFSPQTTPSLCSRGMDMFCRLINDWAPVTDAVHLFQGLLTPVTHLDWVINYTAQPRVEHSWQQDCCGQVLPVILSRCGESLYAMTPVGVELPNAMAPLRDALYSRFNRKVGGFADAFVLTPLGVGRISTRHLYLCKLLGILVRESPAATLEKFSKEFWMALVKAFLVSRENTCFHTAAFTILSTAITSNHEATLQTLFLECGFLTVLLSALPLPERPCSRDAFAIVYCNMLHLTCEKLGQSSFLAQFLNTQIDWINAYSLLQYVDPRLDTFPLFELE